MKGYELNFHPCAAYFRFKAFDGSVLLALPYYVSKTTARKEQQCPTLVPKLGVMKKHRII